MFPEIDYDKVATVRGMDIIICTTAAMTNRQKNCSAASTCAVPQLEFCKEEKHMAKVSAVNRNNKRKKLSKSLGNKRAKLKELIANKEAPMEERFAAVLKLAEMPRNSSKTRIRNRCALTAARAVTSVNSTCAVWLFATRIAWRTARRNEIQLVRETKICP